MIYESREQVEDMDRDQQPKNNHDIPCMSFAEGAQTPPEPKLSEESTNSVEKELMACQAEVSEWREKFLHANADFQNYKRRQEKERGLWMHSSQAQVLKELLTIVDDFDRALESSTVSSSADQTSSSDSWRTGFSLIHASLYKLLAKFDVTEITEQSIFNPELHEAISTVAVPDQQAGAIVQVVQKGFMFKGQVLRPAKVIVAQ